jgi:hypothetical protein
MELDTQLVAAPVCCAVCVPLAGREAKKNKTRKGGNRKKTAGTTTGREGPGDRNVLLYTETNSMHAVDFSTYALRFRSKYTLPSNFLTLP